MKKDDKLGREVAEQLGKTYEEYELELSCAVLISIYGEKAVWRTLRQICYDYARWDKENGAGLP